MMKKLMYLMVASCLVVFSACKGGGTTEAPAEGNETPGSEVEAPKGAAEAQDSTDMNMNKEDEESHDDHSHEGHSHD